VYPSCSISDAGANTLHLKDSGGQDCSVSKEGQHFMRLVPHHLVYLGKSGVLAESQPWHRRYISGASVGTYHLPVRSYNSSALCNL
jgi:hypothetical protein